MAFEFNKLIWFTWSFAAGMTKSVRAQGGERYVNNTDFILNVRSLQESHCYSSDRTFQYKLQFIIYNRVTVYTLIKFFVSERKWFLSRRNHKWILVLLGHCLVNCYSRFKNRFFITTITHRLKTIGGKSAKYGCRIRRYGDIVLLPTMKRVGYYFSCTLRNKI